MMKLTEGTRMSVVWTILSYSFLDLKAECWLILDIHLELGERSQGTSTWPQATLAHSICIPSRSTQVDLVGGLATYSHPSTRSVQCQQPVSTFQRAADACSESSRRLKETELCFNANACGIVYASGAASLAIKEG